jgi:hypothetical protein
MSTRPSVRDSRFDLTSSALHSVESKKSPVMNIQRSMAVNRSLVCQRGEHNFKLRIVCGASTSNNVLPEDGIPHPELCCGVPSI